MIDISGFGIKVGVAQAQIVPKVSSYLTSEYVDDFLVSSVGFSHEFGWAAHFSLSLQDFALAQFVAL